MQIGEFAKICNTRISVLRHYDKLGLLTPSRTDPATGYRYYSGDQAAVFFRIGALKQAGFSLAEIRDILGRMNSDDEVLERFDAKERELLETLENLRNARKKILKGVTRMKIEILPAPDEILAKTAPLPPDVINTDFLSVCTALDKAVTSENYQRISGFRTYGSPHSDEVAVGCAVVRLTDTYTVPLNDPLPEAFEDDPDVIGKWQVVGLYRVKDDFFAGYPRYGDWYGDHLKELYFLPNGGHYWIYQWSKGVLYTRNGDGCTANPYEIEEYDGNRYLFIRKKSQEYRRGGEPMTLVLRQTDRKTYTIEEIAHRDNVNLPFANDERVHGKWCAHSMFRDRNAFDPDKPQIDLFWNGVEFRENGELIRWFDRRSIPGRWTNGHLLDLRERLDCAYEVTNVGGTEYLIVEWKNGDYIYGGYRTGYIAFVREGL